MKLGFILFDYFPFGGLQRDCLNIARLCIRRGHGVTIFARTWQGERPGEIQVELLGRNGLTNISRNRHYLKQLSELLPRRGLDGVVGFNKIPGVDVYYGADPCYAAKIARLKPKWYRWLPRYKHFEKLERGIFQCGRKTEILLLVPDEIPAYRQFYRTEPERFHVLPPGIERHSLNEPVRIQTRGRVRREHGWSEGENLLLFVGSGFRTKGLDRAIHALGALENSLREKTRLVVIGQNPVREFGLLARRLGVGDRVQFLGGRHDVPDFLLAADLLIHPAYSENTGAVLLEAAASGLPVLATASCGFAFHITDAKAGIVVPNPFSQEFLNAALAEMLTSKQRAAWRANGLAYAASEDLYSCHERAADIIEETIRAKLK